MVEEKKIEIEVEKTEEITLYSKQTRSDSNF